MMRRAVLVAASDFAETESFMPLRFPVSDARRLRDVLLDPQLCGFDEAVLVDNQPSRVAQRALERAARASERGDLLLFYYSGHGQLDRDGTLALATPDSEREFLSTTSLVSEELKRLFKMSRASQKVMILDCCYGGAAWDGGEFKGSVADSVTALAQQIDGTFLLTASTRFQPAFEVGELEGGALTSCFVEGLETGAAAPPDSDHVTLSQLWSYVRRRVPEHGAQQPQCWDLGGVGDLRFSKKRMLYDAAWARRARRLVSKYCADSLMSEELGAEIRGAIEAREEPLAAARLDLVDALLRKQIGIDALAAQWNVVAGPGPDAAARTSPREDEKQSLVPPAPGPTRPPPRQTKAEPAPPPPPPPTSAGAPTAPEGGWSRFPAGGGGLSSPVPPSSRGLWIAGAVVGFVILLALIFGNLNSADEYVANTYYDDEALMGGDITSVDAVNGTDANMSADVNGAATEPYYEDKAEAYDTSNTGTGNMQ